MQYDQIMIYIDEVGRGSIAGPVVVGLVLGSKFTDRLGYCDSKTIGHKQREQLYTKILSDSSIVRTTGSASAKEIDRYGIVRALKWSVIRGLYRLLKKLQLIANPTQKKQCYRKSLINSLGMLQNSGSLKLIIDGNHDFGLSRELGVDVETIIKGDYSVPQIGAASIVAKVTRDRQMMKLGQNNNYVGYGFEHHVGYGTRKHYDAINKQGLCDIHRTKRIRIDIKGG